MTTGILSLSDGTTIELRTKSPSWCRQVPGCGATMPFWRGRRPFERHPVVCGSASVNHACETLGIAKPGRLQCSPLMEKETGHAKPLAVTGRGFVVPDHRGRTMKRSEARKLTDAQQEAECDRLMARVEAADQKTIESVAAIIQDAKRPLHLPRCSEGDRLHRPAEPHHEPR